MASFEIAGEADGLMRFHADRISVSGTSREEYRESRDSTVKCNVSYYPLRLYDDHLTSYVSSRTPIGTVDFLVFRLV